LGKAVTCAGFESFVALFDFVGLAYLYTEILVRSSTIMQQAKIFFKFTHIHVINIKEKTQVRFFRAIKKDAPSI
jgi:hypothetical protein